MDTMITKLITELREETGYDHHHDTTELLNKAADALEAAQTELARMYRDGDAYLTALAACRDAFPAPERGSDLDNWLLQAIAEPLAVPDYVKAQVAAAGASPAQPAKDHEIAALVNRLTEIAKQFHGAQQLRERISHEVAPFMKMAQPFQAVRLSTEQMRCLEEAHNLANEESYFSARPNLEVTPVLLSAFTAAHRMGWNAAINAKGEAS